MTTCYITGNESKFRITMLIMLKYARVFFKIINILDVGNRVF